MKVVVKLDDRVFEVEIENISARPITATVEGEKFEVWPDNPSLGPIEPGSASSEVFHSTPASTASKPANPSIGNLSGKTMTSPLPGVVTEVFVKAGETIESGHVMLVIEAMKMKNSIRSTRPGKISAVLVNAGETVNHKQPLIEFSE